MSRVQIEYVKKLFSAFKSNDKEGFLRTAEEIIEDEHKKKHHALAEELQAIINRRSTNAASGMALLASQPEISIDQALLFQRIYPENQLSRVILSPENKEKIDQIIREFFRWDVFESNGAYPIRTVLFYGPPGCGKTITAKAIATELEVPLLYVRFDAIVSSHLGETASNIRKVFDFASKDSYVILFDEFDAIARSRNDESENGEIKRVVSTFLQLIDNFKGHSIIIAATNFEQSLDYAIWRRFDSTLRFDMPSMLDRITLFNLKLRRYTGSDIDMDEFVAKMDKFTFDDVERAANEVIKKCLLDVRNTYTQKDVESALDYQKRIVSLRRTQYEPEGKAL
jgi:AAA+ superfamily predicted ATPase